MRSHPLCLVAFLGASSFGCSYATLEASHVPNPVTLGPVDRVGGHRGGGEKTIAPITSEVNDFVAASSDTKRVGNMEVTTTTTTVIMTGSALVTIAVLERTEGRPDRDVRVDRIPAGGYAMVSFTSALAERWVGLNGRVVEVSHGR